jgi:hypothetical protein
LPTESPTLRVTGSIPVGTTRAANTRLPLIIITKIGTKPARRLRIPKYEVRIPNDILEYQTHLLTIPNFDSDHTKPDGLPY